ncbi:unnamed protein product, partial [Ectocarpus sp. 8 AP-2014]
MTSRVRLIPGIFLRRLFLRRNMVLVRGIVEPAISRSQQRTPRVFSFPPEHGARRLIR